MFPPFTSKIILIVIFVLSIFHKMQEVIFLTDHILNGIAYKKGDIHNMINPDKDLLLKEGIVKLYLRSQKEGVKGSPKK